MGQETTILPSRKHNCPVPIIEDVQIGPYKPLIESIYLHGITGGCVIYPSLRCCSSNPVTRSDYQRQLLMYPFEILKLTLLLLIDTGADVTLWPA
jgi:hypothetical protein